MPPKQQNPTVIMTAKGKKPMAKPTPGKAPVKQEKAPAWWVFTKVSSTFVERAKVLANLLTEKYGEGVSISHYERMLGELDSMPPQHVDLLDLSEEHLVAYQEYLDAKKARDAERESFRSSRDVCSIESGLAKATTLIKPHNEEEEVTESKE
jgi:hypothetical protein